MAMKFANNATSKLVEAITADATTLKIKSEDVAKFPVLDSSAKDFMHVTIVGGNAEHEIVKVTAVAADGTFTIERAQEGTVAKEWPIENRVELRITAFYLNSAATQDVVDMVESAITELETKINNLTTAVEADKVIADNVTIIRNVEKKIIAKDIAIDGDSSDLASARGFIYDNFVPFYPSIGNAPATNMDNLLRPGKYHIVISKDTLNIPSIKGFTSTGTTDGIIEIDVISSATSVSSFVRRKQVLTIYGIGTTAEIWSRCQVTNVSDTNSWQPWEQEIRSGDIGEGIKNTNGVLSVPTYVGATDTTDATSGLVPAATSGERSNFLCGDGTWQHINVDLSDYALKTELTKYLPLIIEDSSVDVQYTRYLNFVPKNNITSGGFVKLSIPSGGGAASGNPCFTLGAYKKGESSSIKLVGTDNGRLTWDDKDLVRSVAGVGASEAGDIPATALPFLPLSGGKLTGNMIKFAGLASYRLEFIKGSTNHALLLFKDDNTGAYLWLRDEEDTIAPGLFDLSARKAGKVCALTGSADGVLAWNNTHIVRSVNGVGADASGNVGISRVWQCDASDICYGALGWWHGGATLPNYGTWAYIMSTNYRGIGVGSSDGATWAGEAAGGTYIGGDNRGTGLLAVRKG